MRSIHLWPGGSRASSLLDGLIWVGIELPVWEFRFCHMQHGVVPVEFSRTVYLFLGEGYSFAGVDDRIEFECADIGPRGGIPCHQFCAVCVDDRESPVCPYDGVNREEDFDISNQFPLLESFSDLSVIFWSPRPHHQ